MQQKESESNRHFKISLIKSFLRIVAGVILLYTDPWYLNAVGGLLVGAELLGIAEEF